MLNVKYRPKKIEQLFGNSSVKESLITLFERKTEDIPQVFLFTGKSGTGKTTMAYIIKNHLECSDMDFNYYNTANTRGIDTVRAMIDVSNYKPIDGKVKIYVLDEIHKQTNEAQNALLNILEKPPHHVYFILCTTEPDKLLITIRRRCTQYEMVSLLRVEITNLLKSVVKKERKEVDVKVLNKIVSSSKGSAGLALKLLDTVIDMKKEEEAINVINDIVISEDNVIEICRALVKNNNWEEVKPLLKNLKGEPEQNRRAILGYFDRVLLNNGGKREAEIMMCFMENLFYTGKPGFDHACFLACQV